MSGTLIKLANEQPHLRSSVGGRHCGHCEGMLDSHALAISAAAPGTAFLAMRMGLFRSDDRGATWHDTDIGRYSSPLRYCRDVIVSPHDPRVMYAAPVAGRVQHRGFALPQRRRGADVAAHRPRGEGRIDRDGGCSAPCAIRRASTASTRGGQVIGTEDSGKILDRLSPAGRRARRLRRCLYLSPQCATRAREITESRGEYCVESEAWRDDTAHACGMQRRMHPATGEVPCGRLFSGEARATLPRGNAAAPFCRYQQEEAKCTIS